MELTQPQGESYWSYNGDGNQVADTERRFRAVKTPLWQLGPCHWMMLGPTEHHMTKIYNFETEQIESADKWFPSVGVDWWWWSTEPYQSPVSGFYSTEAAYNAAIGEFDEYIASLDEDDPIRKWQEAIGGLRGKFGRKGIHAQYAGLTAYYWGYFETYGYAWARPATGSLRLYKGQWWYTVHNYSGLYYGNEAWPHPKDGEEYWYSDALNLWLTPYAPIDRKDWNCGGLNVFERHEDAPEHFPATIEIRTTRNKELQ